MAKKVLMSLELLFTVPDDYELCNGGEDANPQWPGCAGHCGGEDDQYFFGRARLYLSNDESEKSTEYVSLTLENHEDEDDEST